MPLKHSTRVPQLLSPHWAIRSHHFLCLAFLFCSISNLLHTPHRVKIQQQLSLHNLTFREDPSNQVRVLWRPFQKGSQITNFAPSAEITETENAFHTQCAGRRKREKKSIVCSTQQPENQHMRMNIERWKPTTWSCTCKETVISLYVQFSPSSYTQHIPAQLNGKKTEQTIHYSGLYLAISSLTY